MLSRCETTVRKRGVVNLDGLGEHFRVFVPLRFVKRADAFGQFAARLVRLDLELVRLALLALGLFVADFHENDFAQFAEGRRRRKPARRPTRFGGIFDGRDQRLFADGLNVQFGPPL